MEEEGRGGEGFQVVGELGMHVCYRIQSHCSAAHMAVMASLQRTYQSSSMSPPPHSPSPPTPCSIVLTANM